MLLRCVVSEPHGKVDISPACPAPTEEGGTRWASPPVFPSVGSPGFCMA